MRYCLSIDLNKKEQILYSFKGTEISKHLKIEKQYQPEKYVKLITLFYDRKKLGLIERNWNNPIYDDEKYFLFIAGYTLYRNSEDKNYPVPSPKEVLAILLKHGEAHYNFIKGNYYIVLLHKNLMKAELYSSPMFMQPAFYAFQDNHLIFSNYIESFKNYVKLSTDTQGLVEFSLFDHSIHNRTVYTEIKSVPGGHLIVFENQKILEKLVYDVAKWFTHAPKKRNDSLNEINTALKTAINNYIKNTDTFNTSLTGGFDGRLNFSFIEKVDYPRLKTMSYGMSGSKQIEVPKYISGKLGFDYRAVLLDEAFESVYSEMGHASINLTCGVTGFNRAVYPYAYNIIKDYSRSCMIGQCDMIRPLYNNPAGVIFNEFSNAIFFNDFHTFQQNVLNFSKKAFIQRDLFSEECIKNIYDEIKERYITNYPHLNNKLRFYFFLLKESMMKYWHTEFHIVDIFVDDYVSFADLDYLELLFNSEYAGIYKGLLAPNQFGRMHAQDLYVDLMTLNNNKLNYIMLDRNFMPGWLKFGFAGWVLSAISKKIGLFRNQKIRDDTFNAEKWNSIFYRENNQAILRPAQFFNMPYINQWYTEIDWDSNMSYRFNRAISLKLWLTNFLTI